MSKTRGATGKARPPPRQPTPIPRTFQLVFTDHAKKRCEIDRGIPANLVEETIVNGREHATDERGTQGGFISKFEKTFINRDSGVPVSRRVIAVCEVWSDKCLILTAYYG